MSPTSNQEGSGGMCNFTCNAPKPGGFYEVHVVPGIKSMLLGIVAVGIGLVGSDYVQLFMIDAGALKLLDYWFRIALLFVLICYAAYDHLIYGVVATATRKLDELESGKKRTGDHGLVGLYMIDILQVIVLGATVYVLDVDTAKIAVGKTADVLAIERRLLTAIFLFLTIWHGLIWLWHVITDGVLEGFKSGLVTYFLLSLGSFICFWVNFLSHTPPTDGGKALFAAVVFGFAMVLLFYRAPKLIEVERPQ